MGFSWDDVVVIDHLVYCLVIILGVGSPGESVSLAVVLALNELDHVVENFWLNDPLHLLRSIGADDNEELEVLVVCLDLYLVSGTSEVVSPALKG
jgi:hypothetical protein